MNSAVMILADSATSSAGLWGGAVSVGIFVVSRIAWDAWEARQKRILLTHVLLMECFGTIRKLAPVLDDLEYASNSARDSRGDRLDFIVRLPSRITFAGPSPELQQLLTLLPKDRGSDLLRFTDRWSRMLLLTAAYEAAYANACECAAKVDGKSPLHERLCDEYITQLISVFNDCAWLGHGLCDIACKIIRRYGPHQDHDFSKMCDGLWNRWADHDCSQKRFGAGYMKREILVVEFARKWDGVSIANSARLS